MPTAAAEPSVSPSDRRQARGAMRRAAPRIGALAAALGLLALPLLPAERGIDPALFRELGNAVHFPLLGLAALLLFAACGPLRRASFARYVGVAAAGVGAAVLIELIQPGLHRTASVGDVVRGAAGIAAALGGAYAWLRGGARSRAVHAALSLVAVAVLAAPVWPEWRAVAWRTTSFPLLADFESPIELRLWRSRGSADAPTRLHRVTDHASVGDHALEVRTGGGRWPGMTFNAGGADWSAFESLDFEVFNPGEEFRLAVRIDDGGDTSDAGSRFRRDVTVQPGGSHVSIPVEAIRSGARDRDLDMSDIRRVLFFVDAGQERRFYLDGLRLSGTASSAAARN